MKITKAMLEREIIELKLQKELLYNEVCWLKEKVKILSLSQRGSEALIIALERSTQAVAHVITDLKERR